MLVYNRIMTMNRSIQNNASHTSRSGPTRHSQIITDQEFDSFIIKLTRWSHYGKDWRFTRLLYQSEIVYRSREFQITFIVDNSGMFYYVHATNQGMYAVYDFKDVRDTINNIDWTDATPRDIVDYRIKKHINLEDALIPTWRET